MPTIDWTKFLSDNFAAITGLLGVIIGAAGAFLAQSRLQATQRKWALDDQKRLWKRERLMDLRMEIGRTVNWIAHDTAMWNMEESIKDSVKRQAEGFLQQFKDKGIVLTDEMWGVVQAFFKERREEALKPILSEHLRVAQEYWRSARHELLWMVDDEELFKSLMRMWELPWPNRVEPEKRKEAIDRWKEATVPIFHRIDQLIKETYE